MEEENEDKKLAINELEKPLKKVTKRCYERSNLLL